jgi:hypothetical protein
MAYLRSSGHTTLANAPSQLAATSARPATRQRSASHPMLNDAGRWGRISQRLYYVIQMMQLLERVLGCRQVRMAACMHACASMRTAHARHGDAALGLQVGRQLLPARPLAPPRPVHMQIVS